MSSKWKNREKIRKNIDYISCRNLTQSRTKSIVHIYEQELNLSDDWKLLMLTGVLPGL